VLQESVLYASHIILKIKSNMKFITFMALGLVSSTAAETWRVDSQDDWAQFITNSENILIKDGFASPVASEASIKSSIKTFKKKQKVNSITVQQSAEWLNWNPIPNIGPKNLRDAPVLLALGPDDYWIFGRYGNSKGDPEAEAGKPAKLEGFDIELSTTNFAHQFDAAGGKEPKLGGYHAWQSKDMKNWVHHGSITNQKSKWMTTAEYVDGKAYFYFDFPNDQDPHLYIDDNLFDGKLGKDMGMAFEDPSHGSDCAIIRSLDGKFHLISEDWSPIRASNRSWDSPLASHAVSADGTGGFELQAPAVDYRTKPTGKIETYKHPHWVKEDPARFPSNIAEYEVHLPEQDAYGDWAAISIGGQYYLFGDYDPAGAHGARNMKVAWFTSSSIDEPFKFCSSIGQGHPDPDVIFAEGNFYLATQTANDFISPGPWVESVEVRVGVDTDGDGSMDQYSEWAKVSESYDYIEGFSKQISRTPAQLDLSKLPEGFGFQFEMKLEDTTENESKPKIDAVELNFN